MSFLELIQTVGGKLGILEARIKTSGEEPEKLTTRTVTLEELKSEIRSEQVRALAELPAELTLSFDKIFEAAGITNASEGWSLVRLRELLATPRFRDMDRSATQHALMETLGTDPATAEALVKEAVGQDQALDAFEEFVNRKVAVHMAECEHRISEIDARIQTLQSERTRLAERLHLEQEKLREWRLRKRGYERELAATVSYLTEKPVIRIEAEEGSAQ